MLAFLGEGAGDPLRHVVDAVGDDVADLADLVGKAEVDAGNGVADLLGLADQGVALVGELAEQVADTDFVVVIGALERRDLVMNEGLEFSGARKRTLDAVAHRRDFAAHRLADIDDLLAGGGFRLVEPHRHLRHGLRDVAQFLGAADGLGEGEGDSDRQNNRGGGCGEERGGDVGLRQQLRELAAEQEGKGDAADHPQDREGGGDEVRGAGGAALKGLKDLANGFAIIVGRTRAVLVP